jgi:UDP-glucose 4-epimerase
VTSLVGSRWLITGGAGYIGAHVVRAFLAAGAEVTVLDDLSTGRRSVVPEGVAFIEGSILDSEAVSEGLRGATGVVHLAARKAPGESVRDPGGYYETNVVGTLRLFSAAIAAGVRRLLFSSSCSVYGTPTDPVVTEATAIAPESPYGESKRIGEMMLAALARSEQAAAIGGVDWLALRYFNVIGCAGEGLGDLGRENLVPVALSCAQTGSVLSVHGGDWPTADGTCIRDYLDVGDLATAHVLGASRLMSGGGSATVNISTGVGHSVLDVVRCVQQHLPHLSQVIGPRRAGDPASVVGSPETARNELGWVPTRTLADSIAAAVKDRFGETPA